MQLHHSNLCFCRLPVSLSSRGTFFFLHDTSCWISAHPNDHLLTWLYLQRPYFQTSHVNGNWGLGLQRILRDTIQLMPQVLMLKTSCTQNSGPVLASREPNPWHLFSSSSPRGDTWNIFTLTALLNEQFIVHGHISIIYFNLTVKFYELCCSAFLWFFISRYPNTFDSIFIWLENFSSSFLTSGTWMVRSVSFHVQKCLSLVLIYN